MYFEIAKETYGQPAWFYFSKIGTIAWDTLMILRFMADIAWW